ncbi:MAG TPA: hypothetical protein VGO86_13185 [Candidatus Dormibacteraeota bacterium]
MAVDPPREELLALLRSHGVRGEIREVSPRAADEAIFVVSPEDAGAANDRDLAIALQRLLNRKVWVVPDQPIWHRQSEPL